MAKSQDKLSLPEEIAKTARAEGDNSDKIHSLLKKAGADAHQIAWDTLRASGYSYREGQEISGDTARNALYNAAPLHNVKPLIDALTAEQKNELLLESFPSFDKETYRRSGRPKAYNPTQFAQKANYLIDQITDPDIKNKVCVDYAITAEPAVFAHLIKGIKNQDTLDAALIALAGSSKTHIGTWERENILAESSDTALANLKALLHGESTVLATTSPQNVLQRLTAIVRDEPHLLEQAGMQADEIKALQHILQIDAPSHSTELTTASKPSTALTQAGNRHLLSKAVGALSQITGDENIIHMKAQHGFRDEVLFRALQEAVLRPNPQAVKELADVIGKQNPDILNWPITKSGRTIIDQDHGAGKNIPDGSSLIAAAALHGSCVYNGYGYPIPLMHNLGNAVAIMVRSLLKNGASCQVDANNNCPIEILQKSTEKKIFTPGRLLEDMHDARAREVEKMQLQSLAGSVVDQLLNELERRNMNMNQDQVATVVEGILSALTGARAQGVGAHSQKIVKSTRPGISDQRGQRE